ncbi:Calcium-binding protein 5 (CaBP5) [Durusdinium trenchii]|uniref:Calcium-binding protein 5 (CaBP5) n=1 Tax=Durusdinium trenchii TaxID=1381693 RepID=A0ABP0JDY6_9DINO
MVAASLNDAPERIKGWSLICGFKEQSFRDWSDFAKYVDDSAGSTVDHLRRTKKGNKLLALPGLKKKGLRRARPSPREGLMQMSGSEPLLHTVHWLRGGIPVSDFRRPMARPQSQPSQGTAISAIRSPTTLTFDEPERPRSSPSKSLLGGLPEKQRQGSHLQSPVPQQHSPRHRHTLAKTMLETLPPIEGLDLTYSESPTLASASSKGPQLFQLAHELRIPAELARQATELFGRYSDGEGPDLFQRRLRMINFPALLCEVTHVSSLSELSPHFVETATRSLNRLNADAIDVREFFIWYSAFSFSEEMTPNKDDHRTRRLAKKLGLEVVDVDDYRKAFDKFDTDGSGAIEIDEFQEILKHLLKLPPETELEPNRVANLFLIADKNHDDVVDFEEFCVFWSQSYGSGDNSQGLENLFASVYRSLRRVPTAFV